MTNVASNHPFPMTTRRHEWFLPAMLTPSLYLVASFAYCLATGSRVLCSPALFMVAGLIPVVYGACVFLRESGPLHRRLCAFCAVLILVYLQLLLPRLWAWPWA